MTQDLCPGQVPVIQEKCDKGAHTLVLLSTEWTRGEIWGGVGLRVSWVFVKHRSPLRNGWATERPSAANEAAADGQIVARVEPIRCTAAQAQAGSDGALLVSCSRSLRHSAQPQKMMFRPGLCSLIYGS